MTTAQYKVIGTSTSTPIDNKKRKEVAVGRPKPVTASRLESTFALDQFTRVAKNSTKAEFIALVVPIFGFDIPAETYIELYDALRKDAIGNPKITLMSGGPVAAFNNGTREILVRKSTADLAIADRNSNWLLLTELLHEFGHYIDLVLRMDLAHKNPDGTSVLDSDAEDDEGAKFAYAIAFYDFANTSEVEYATYTSQDYVWPLRVNYEEAQKAIQRTQGHEAHRMERKRGQLEFFGAGKGENHEKNPHGSFGHQSIEEVLGTIRLNRDERQLIYFGNWLRDYSQMLDPKVVRKESASKDLPNVMSRQAWTRLVDILAIGEFVDKPGKRANFKVTPERLGVYRPSEHIDNPKNTSPKPADPRAVDPDFEPLPTPELLEIDPTTSMKRYIARSVEYMKSELNKAAVAGRNAEGFRHFGAALHVLEDYFAHSNFVELSLRKVGHTDVLAWTSPANCRHRYPVVTGMFESEDVVASTAGMIADKLFDVQWEYEVPKPGERTMADRITAILLCEHSDPEYLKYFEQLLSVRDYLATLPGREYLGMAIHYTLGMILNMQNFVWNSFLHILGNSVDDAQVQVRGDPNTNGSTDPSHSQLAKDHDNHPFHALAATLAMEAVLKVGKEMVARWDGDLASNPANVAAAYIVHPMDAQWQDTIVTNWALKHPKEIKRGTSSTEWEALRKEHEKEVREEIASIMKRSKSGWTYVNSNYENIFGEKNQVKK
jgi:hypothetical protein